MGGLVGARLSDARVWSFLSAVAADRSFEKSYAAELILIQCMFDIRS